MELEVLGPLAGLEALEGLRLKAAQGLKAELAVLELLVGLEALEA